MQAYDALTALSPLDGRYNSQLLDLAQLFSEQRLIHLRVSIELKYLIFLANVGCIPHFSPDEVKHLSAMANTFSVEDATRVKELEVTTKHDVKAVEYFLREKLKSLEIPGSEYLHLAMTSEDVNSLAYSLMIGDGKALLEKTLREVLQQLSTLACEHSKTPMMARTHGQEAVPTTVGKELAVFGIRIVHELEKLDALQIEAKLTGAVGNLNAHLAAFPDKNWLMLSQQFVVSLGLTPNMMTTQILPTESYSEIFSSFIRINGILLDLNQDIWRYVSDHWFGQKVEKQQVGSSTMPQKINPIDFENSEGNLGLANALFTFFIQKLAVSRLQRDLSDSTVKRSIGTAFGYSQLAYLSLRKGLPKLTVNHQRLTQDLDGHWEVLAEEIQVVPRLEGDDSGYEKLRLLTQGKQLTQPELHTYIQSLTISASAKERLLSLRPETYLGYAVELTDQAVQRINSYLKGVS